jgi:RNA recognition motif-containing protein
MNTVYEDKTLHVSDIPFETTEDDLYNFFKDFKIEQIKIVKYLISNIAILIKVMLL